MPTVLFKGDATPSDFVTRVFFVFFQRPVGFFQETEWENQNVLHL